MSDSEKIYSNFEILLVSPTNKDDLLRKAKSFYKYYEPILNSMVGELANRNAGSRNSDFADYTVYSQWALRKLEYSFVLEHVFKELGPNDKILDLGGGVTPFINAFADEDRKIVSTDNSPLSMIFMHRNNKRIYQRECAFHCTDMTDLIYEDNQFDFTITISVLEHLDSIDRIKEGIKEAFRVTKSGGKVIGTWCFQQKQVGMELSPDNFSKMISDILLPYCKEADPSIYLPSEKEISAIWEAYWFPLCKYRADCVPGWSALGFCLTKEGRKRGGESSPIQFKKNLDGTFFDNDLLYLPRKANNSTVKAKYHILNHPLGRVLAEKLLRRLNK